MELLHYVFFFLVALVVLITFHEAGHFLVARWVGVHVVRFSVGFGKPLWSWRDRRGTEFCVAMLPLGGYVRMYDRRDEDAAEHAPADPALAERSYDRLPRELRILILLGGPAANFLLAFLCYWLLAIAGTTVAVPIVGAVGEDSVAARAGLRPGDEIVGVDGRSTRSWNDITLALAARLGDTGVVEVRAETDREPRTLSLTITDWLRGATDPDPLAALGIDASPRAVVGEVLPNEPGARGGLAVADRVTHVDGEPIHSWAEFVEQVRARPDQPSRFTVLRDADELTLRVTPRRSDAGEHGYVGVAAAPQPTRIERLGVWPGLGRALGDTWANTKLTVGLIGKMLTLEVSPKNLAGPITIAKVAGDTARIGAMRFLSLLALLSISLGVINLLPIPILDGGQVVSTLVEMARGKPLSEAAQAMGNRVGIAMVACLMVLAFYSDVTRWFWPG